MIIYKQNQLSVQMILPVVLFFFFFPMALHCLNQNNNKSYLLNNFKHPKRFKMRFTHHVHIFKIFNSLIRVK